MRGKTRKSLRDMQGACELVIQFTAGKTFRDFTTDKMLKSAVERQLGIVGEALNNALMLNPELSERIADARRIIGFRNILIHGYWNLSDDLVWGVIETDLSTLRQEVDRLLNE